MRLRVLILLPLAATMFSCAQLADRNNVRVAKVDGEYITRADVYDYIRSFPDMVRPRINNTADMLAILNRMVDARIKAQYVEPVIMERLDEAQRAALLQDIENEAREEFYKRSGEQGEQMRAVWGMEIPANDEPTELMKVYGLTADSLRDTKAFITAQTEAISREILADRAVQIMTGEALKKGEIDIPQDTLELEFAFQKESLVVPETVTFTGIRIAAREPGAAEKAKAARQRIDSGEQFDFVAEGFRSQSPQSVTQNTLQHNDSTKSFEDFWAAIEGKGAGEVAGPIFMPAYQQMAVDAQGNARQVTIPETIMVIRIDAREPQRPMTLQEATPRIAPPLLVSEMMKKLREAHGVEIYEDKLPEAGQFSGVSNAKPLA
ncbi:MAG: hypothetical protein GC168_17495 [Candidatus Hydrogenedens sp.]|nr:hypothetical protein [Candidatus Hydrogenedens sp.]